MTRPHLLILGGTAQARALAQDLSARGDLAVTLSLAGRTERPLPQMTPGAGSVRNGGFGGVDGLARYLADARVDAILDATHPFAARMSVNAAEAAQRCGVPLVALRRPAWTPVPGDRWHEVESIAAAAATLGEAPQTVFLTIGRQEVAAFRAAPAHRYIIRSIDPVAPGDLPPRAETILARGPFDVAAETALLRDHAITVVVAKNAGGSDTYGKIAAARACGLPVILVRRPAVPEVASVPDVPAAIAAVIALLHAHPSGFASARGE